MPHWFHWADGGGYNFVSGPLADITLVTAALAAILTYWRRHNCHVHRCWRLSWHPHPEHGHPVCRKHHPAGQGRADHLHASHHTVERHLEILKAHQQANAVSWSGVTSTAYGGTEFVNGERFADEPDLPPSEHEPGTVTDITTKQKPDG